MARTRTAKSCGPDAAVLASSRRNIFPQATVARKPITGEITKETVKTIARGMPGYSGVTVVTNACAFYQYTRGCGRIERPAFPAPSDWRVRNFLASLGRMASRDRGVVSCRHCEERLVRRSSKSEGGSDE